MQLVLDTHNFRDSVNLIREGIKMRYTATVERVIDGDTIDVRVPLQTGLKRLRLAGIDAPKKNLRDGIAANPI